MMSTSSMTSSNLSRLHPLAKPGIKPAEIADVSNTILSLPSPYFQMSKNTSTGLITVRPSWAPRGKPLSPSGLDLELNLGKVMSVSSDSQLADPLEVPLEITHLDLETMGPAIEGYRAEIRRLKSIMNELRSERESIASDPSRIIDTTQVELELFRTAEFRSRLYDDLLPMISQLQSIRQGFAGSLAEDSQVETKVPELVTKIWDLEPEAWGGFFFSYEELIAGPDEGRIVQASTDADEGLSCTIGGLHDAREEISKNLARYARYQTERIVCGVHWPYDALINARQETEIGSRASRVKTSRLLSDGVMGRWAFDKSRGGAPVWILATDIPSECPAEGEEPDIEGRPSRSELDAADDDILSPSISSTGPPVNSRPDD